MRPASAIGRGRNGGLNQVSKGVHVPKVFEILVVTSLSPNLGVDGHGSAEELEGLVHGAAPGLHGGQQVQRRNAIGLALQQRLEHTRGDVRLAVAQQRIGIQEMRDG